MKRTFLLPTLAAAAVTLAGCAGLDGSDRAATAAPLLEGTRWALVEVGDHEASALDEQRAAYLLFDADEQRVSGSTGCNRLMGGYQLDDDRLVFEQLATTMMACPPAVMESEQAFLEALEAVSAWHQEGETLLLVDEAGEPLARFAAQPVP